MEMTQDSESYSATQHTNTPCQYLTFRLVDETYAVGILQVREILRYEELTKVPSIPNSIRGVLNLRGSVVPVVDLAVKFGLPSYAVTKWTCIVIVESVLDGEHTVMGILADSVSEVLDLREDDIEPPPPFGTKVHVDYLIGMGKSERRFILVLDIDKVLSADDVPRVTDALEPIETAEPESPIGEVDKNQKQVINTKSIPETKDKDQNVRTTKPNTIATSKDIDTKTKEGTLLNQVSSKRRNDTEKTQNPPTAPVEKNAKASSKDEKAEQTAIVNPAKNSEKVDKKETKNAMVKKDIEDKKAETTGTMEKKELVSEKAAVRAEKDKIENEKKT